METITILPAPPPLGPSGGQPQTSRITDDSSFAPMLSFAVANTGKIKAPNSQPSSPITGQSQPEVKPAEEQLQDFLGHESIAATEDQSGSPSSSAGKSTDKISPKKTVKADTDPEETTEGKSVNFTLLIFGGISGYLSPANDLLPADLERTGTNLSKTPLTGQQETLVQRFSVLGKITLPAQQEDALAQTDAEPDVSFNTTLAARYEDLPPAVQDAISQGIDLVDSAGKPIHVVFLQPDQTTEQPSAAPAVQIVPNSAPVFRDATKDPNFLTIANTSGSANPSRDIPVFGIREIISSLSVDHFSEQQDNNFPNLIILERSTTSELPADGSVQAGSLQDTASPKPLAPQTGQISLGNQDILFRHLTLLEKDIPSDLQIRISSQPAPLQKNSATEPGAPPPDKHDILFQDLGTLEKNTPPVFQSKTSLQPESVQTRPATQPAETSSGKQDILFRDLSVLDKNTPPVFQPKTSSQSESVQKSPATQPDAISSSEQDVFSPTLTGQEKNIHFNLPPKTFAPSGTLQATAPLKSLAPQPGETPSATQDILFQDLTDLEKNSPPQLQSMRSAQSGALPLAGLRKALTPSADGLAPEKTESPNVLQDTSGKLLNPISGTHHSDVQGASRPPLPVQNDPPAKETVAEQASPVSDASVGVLTAALHKNLFAEEKNTTRPSSRLEGNHQTLVAKDVIEDPKDLPKLQEKSSLLQDMPGNRQGTTLFDPISSLDISGTSQQSGQFSYSAILSQNQPTGQHTTATGASHLLGSWTAPQELSVVNQVIQNFQINTHSPTSKLVIKLSPEELGELKIDIQIKEGAIKANIVAQTEQVQQVLEKYIPKLRNLMEQQGLTIDDILVTNSSDNVGGRDLFRQDLTDSRDFSQPGKSKKSASLADLSFGKTFAQSTEPLAGVNVTV